MSISFAQLAPGCSVRYMESNGEPYVSVRDVIKVVCDKTDKEALQFWNRDIQMDVKVAMSFKEHKFPGPWQKPQPVAKIQSILSFMSNAIPASSRREEAIRILQAFDIDHENQSDHVDKRQKLVHALPNVAEQNGHLKEQITLYHELYDIKLEKESKMKDMEIEKQIKLQREKNIVEIEKQREKNELQIAKETKIKDVKLDFQREQLALRNEERKAELEHKQALKALDAPPETLSIRKVYLQNKTLFPNLRNKYNEFVQDAGLIVAKAYLAKHGQAPKKLKEADGLKEANVYPVHAEHMILDGLREAYRKLSVGNGQRTIGWASLNV